MLLLLHILVHLLRKLILCYSRVAKFDNVLLRHRNHDSDFTGSQNILEEGREDTAMLFHPTDPHMRRRRVPHTRRRRVGGARLYLLVATVAAIIFTIIFSLFGAYMTGRHRLRCTKGIIFMATVLVSTFTVIAMILARRTLQEALLAGLLESVTGFVLVLEVHDFVTS
ncbi:hypothetical protein BDV96DRAFT_14618 [Lophiotrema nucula]|uniref:Transmembrane protein n=1 Tax=Lophiotrema nucula TaxID=690887 RepID=A0A6A5ZTU5_9PLEO|nr:hypothetical protein BDV96DRAFT_14618 [Lophiotrema nucula]